MCHARALRALPTHLPFRPADAVINVYSTLEQSTVHDMRDGSTWYLRAHEHAQELADRYRLRSVSQAAGVIAALSPQAGWEHNLESAHTLCADPTAEPHTHLFTERARAILQGQPPLTVLGGRKVRSFYANIADPQHHGPVTVDRHAVACLAGMSTPKFNADPRRSRCLERYGVYQTCAGIIRSVAREYGILPHELQAILWLTHRRIHETNTIDRHREDF